MKTEMKNSEMPTFHMKLNIPAEGEYGTLVTGYLAIRYYAPWGDGSADGWQTPVTPPTISCNGIVLKNELWFSADSEPSTETPYAVAYLTGNQGAGYDQHAQYYKCLLTDISPSDGYSFDIHGTFQQAGYFSIVGYFSADNNGNPTRFQIEILDRDLPTTPEGTNPFIINNPSVFSYDAGESTTYEVNDAESERVLPETIVAPTLRTEVSDDGQVSFFRVDKYTSTYIIADEIAVDGCSQGYLYANKNNTTQEVCILRMKVPETFIHNDSPDTTFSDYQCREFTVGSHISGYSGLGFWTVSSRMLNDYIDADGYAYVFFVPDEFAKQLVDEQGTAAKTPPVMTWGNYTGYVLGNPSYAVILRYRIPNNTWQGNPINATCYPTPESLEPVTAEELGDFLPELYGDTFENFEAGIIGAVTKDASWPD